MEHFNLLKRDSAWTQGSALLCASGSPLRAFTSNHSLTIKNFYYLFLFLLSSFIIWSIQNNIFFWDTIQLGSKHAHWFFENGFNTFLLPENIDSGHPPTFGLYLAFLWTILGKTLMVSHWAMLPFVFGNLILIFKIGEHFGKQVLEQGRGGVALLLLFLADPVVAGQMVLISPDVVLLICFLTVFYGILKDNVVLKVIGATGLAVISMRGMMVALMLYLFELVKNWKGVLFRGGSLKAAIRVQTEVCVTRALPYIPGGVLALLFLVFHYQQTGWIGYHENSPWSPSFEKVGLMGFIKNTAILGWRMLESGRIFVWLGMLILFWRMPLKKLWEDKVFRQLIGLLVLSVLVLSPSMLLHEHLSAPRYLLPVFMAISLLFFYTFLKSWQDVKGLKNLSRLKKPILVFALVCLGLFAGNWLYPPQLSRAWDSTLAHVPYYQLRENAIHYIEEKNIPFAQVGTAFPEIGPFKFKDLTHKEVGFSKKDLSQQQYILYSNVMNDFSDEEILLLKKEWQQEKIFKSGGIYFILYKK